MKDSAIIGHVVGEASAALACDQLFDIVTSAFGEERSFLVYGLVLTLRLE